MPCNIDVWSIGCIMAETIISMPLFFEQNPTTILKQIVSVIGRPPPEMLRNMSRIKVCLLCACAQLATIGVNI